jgi:uncharacterized damage-inducible protein DinB
VFTVNARSLAMPTTGLVAFLLLAAVSAADQGGPQEEVVRQLQARWIASGEYTLAVAEQMPADKYVFRPTLEQMTFAEQMLHIAEQNRLILHEMLGVGPPDKSAIAPAKTDVIRRLKETTGLGLKLLQDHKSNSPAGIASLLNGMMLALDHTTHHRGQAIVYLRLNGLTPPEYRR